MGFGRIFGGYHRSIEERSFQRKWEDGMVFNSFGGDMVSMEREKTGFLEGKSRVLMDVFESAGGV